MKYKSVRRIRKYILFLIIIISILAAGFYKTFSADKKPLADTVSEEVKDILASTAALTPSVKSEVEVTKKVFGYSAKGKPIEGYVIGSGENGLFLFGSIHGNEMGTADLLNRLVKEIKADPKLVGNDMKIIILPIVNPDGYFDRIDKLNANEVNLNLNFDTTDWLQYGKDEGHWAGNKPFSEPESMVIKEIVENYKPKRMISYHSKGAIVNPEYNHESSLALALWYAEKTGYQFYGDGDWDYSGTATRWFKETTNNATITVELSDHINNDWEINKAALLELVS